VTFTAMLAISLLIVVASLFIPTVTIDGGAQEAKVPGH